MGWVGGGVLVVLKRSASVRERESCMHKCNVHDVVIVGVSTRIPIMQDAAFHVQKKKPLFFSMKNTRS